MKIFGDRRLSSIVSRAWGGCLLVVLTCLWQGVSLASTDEKKPLRVVEDKQYELIDIPLVPWPRGGMLDYEPTFYGFWLDDNHLVMSVLQDVPDAYAKHLERIVMIDARTGNYRVLVEQGHVNCRNSKVKVMAYLPYELSYYWGNSSRKIPDDYLFIGLDDEGQTKPLTGPSPIERNCAPAGSLVGLPPTVRRGVNLKEDHGYIDLSENSNVRFRYGTAKLVRPGQAPIELGIPTVAVGWPVYLPYFKKYLTTTMPYGDELRTHVEFRKNHPGGGPYYLVGLDGSVDTVPYPGDLLREYGFPGGFYLWPTPTGVLINITGGPLAPEAGLFLLQGEKLIRIWGGNPNLFSRRHGTLERSYVLNISPDGCRVVFLHAEKYPLPKDKNPAPIPLSILNICKEQ